MQICEHGLVAPLRYEASSEWLHTLFGSWSSVCEHFAHSIGLSSIAHSLFCCIMLSTRQPLCTVYQSPSISSLCQSLSAVLNCHQQSADMAGLTDQERGEVRNIPLKRWQYKSMGAWTHYCGHYRGAKIVHC